jgi:predicted 3-demethylubiquinone-9 3-methyltransferase (glyoxalase superfamily)
MQRITPNLWFDTEAEDAASFYCWALRSAADGVPAS